MFADAKESLSYMRAEDVQMIDLKTVDLVGRWHHVTVPASSVTEDALGVGVGVDTSSYPGYKRVEAGDMRVVPDLSTGMLDPYCAHRTLSFICDIVEPISGEPYGRDPRGVAKRAERYFGGLITPGEAVFSPELEFYILSDVRYESEMRGAGYRIDARSAPWNTDAEELPNQGYKLRAHDGYHVVPPSDQLHDLRSAMVEAIETAGVPVRYHHHEVGAPGQVEIEVGFGSLLEMADAIMKMKYVIRNEAYRAGYTATFMPKPMFGEAGSGMHVHQYVSHEGRSRFWDPGDTYAHLSEMALNWTGGLLKHSAALLAFCSPSTNSYKRLVPGYEAPISCFFGLSNRTAAVRVPAYAVNEHEVRIEFRPPDATCNPYLCLSAMMMAGVDGVHEGVDLQANHFGPFGQNVEEMEEEAREQITQLPTSLEGALDALAEDHGFLLEGGVFSEDLLESWIGYKHANEVAAVGARPHPHEYVLYYDL